MNAKKSVYGPIAKKVITAIGKSRNQKVVNFIMAKTVKIHEEQLKLEREAEDFSELDKLHAVYAQAQHRVAEFIEIFSCLPDSEKFNSLYDSAEDIYMPSGPPMSPITKSHFVCWSSFDMSVGLKYETFTTVMIDLLKEFKQDPLFIRILENLQASRMGLYIHERKDKKFVYFRELYTNKIFKTYIASGYDGIPGQIWLVRILPDPFNESDYHLAFTTPYVIMNSDSSKNSQKINIFMYPEKDWIDFIERNLQKGKIKDPEKAYNFFMKYGIGKHYWLEYIFLAYLNHQENMIILTGFPDKEETLPHSPKYAGFQF